MYLKAETAPRISQADNPTGLCLDGFSFDETSSPEDDLGGEDPFSTSDRPWLDAMVGSQQEAFTVTILKA